MVPKNTGSTGFRIMRADYNKPWRCPGWSGRTPAICNSGSLAPYYTADGNKWGRLYKPHWTIYKCPQCGTHVLPFILRWIEPAELTAMLKRKIRDWKWAITDRKYRREWTRTATSDACRYGEHETCEGLAWITGLEDPVYCDCNCGCDGIGQEANV